MHDAQQEQQQEQQQHAAFSAAALDDDLHRQREPSQTLRILVCIVLEVFTYSLLFFKQIHYLQSI
jgi:hypothetical protein